MSTEYRDADFNPPPNPFRTRDGTTYRDCQPPEAELLAAGFLPVIRAERPAGFYREARTLNNGAWYVYWTEYTPEPEPEPTPALYPDGIETPVIVLTSQASGFGIGVIATDEGEIATYIDHQSPRPDKAEIKRRMTAALAAKREQSAAYLALLGVLENGNAKGVKDAAKAARQKHRKDKP